MIDGELHPRALPNEMAEKTASTAGKKRMNPIQSNGVGSWRFRLLGINSTPAIMPTSPNGTFTKKMSRHPPAARRKPPTVGPSASPTAWAAPWIPIALPSDGFGTARTMMATLFACRSAAPTAWRARNPTSHPRPGASPHSAEPTMKIPNP